MLRFIAVEEILAIHERVMRREASAAESGVINFSAIDAAVDRHRHGPFPWEPDLALRTAFLIRGLAQDHPFVDGNKRTALEAAELFLRLNGHRIRARADDVVDFMLDVAGSRVSLGAGAMDVEDAARWLRHRIRRL